MQYFYRTDHMATYFKSLIIDQMPINLWNARIRHRLKNVIKLPLKSLINPRMQINRKCSLLQIVKRAYIVQTRSMVSMLMCKQQRIHTRNPCTDHLIAEIRPTIHYQTQSIPLYMDRSPQTLIARILTQANITPAANGWNPLRGTGAEESDFHKVT